MTIDDLIPASKASVDWFLNSATCSDPEPLLEAEKQVCRRTNVPASGANQGLAPVAVLTSEAPHSIDETCANKVLAADEYEGISVEPMDKSLLINDEDEEDWDGLMDDED